MIHVSEIDAAVECDDPPVDMQFGAPTPIEAAIGSYIAQEIPDGATLQIGVGGIPNAILNGLKDHKHLGLHTEAMTDGVFRLMQSGVIDNSCKKVVAAWLVSLSVPVTCTNIWITTRMPGSVT